MITYSFILLLEDHSSFRRLKTILHKGVDVKFKPPLTQNKHPKIYVIKHQNEIVYVGYASQSIGTRLGQGLRAKGKNGYHGYKWKKHDEVELFVFVLEAFSGIKSENKAAKDFAEAVEAELVFLVRSKTGKWPECQNEIHFNNTKPKEVRALAVQMFNKLIS